MSFADRARKRAEELGLGASPHQADEGGTPATSTPRTDPPGGDWDDDLVPDVAGDRSPDQIAMDDVLGRLDIIEAYNLWCGKMVADAKGKRESIMVSCPVPGHQDKNPSAAINLDKGDGGVGNCYRCDQGWDKYDLAAWHFGYPVPGYKGKDQFPKLRREMADALGYQVVTSGKEEWLEPKPDIPAPTPASPTATPSPESSTTTTSSGPEAASPSSPASSETDDPARILTPESDPEAFDLSEFEDPEDRPEFAMMSPGFNWREIPGIASDTFLARWMTEMSHSYEPEEFYFFEGLMALAAAVGNNVLFEGGSVRPNLMVCIVGSTGAGKSISMRNLMKLLDIALPWRHKAPTGVRLLGTAGSGEALIDQFIHKTEDETTGESESHVINGLLVEDEMATFAKRAMRHGSTLRELSMALYDSRGRIEHTSRGHGATIVEEHFFQLLTGTQPGSIRKLTSDADAVAGFLNRINFIFGTWKRRPAVQFDFPDVNVAVDDLRRIRAWGSGEKHVHWEPRSIALAKYEAFYLEQIEPLLTTDDSTLEARLGLFAKKMLLLLAVNDRSTTILPHHVEAVQSIWDYLLSCLYRVGANVGRSDTDELSERLLEYFAKRGASHEMTFRDIMKQTSARRFGIEMTRKVLDLLTNVGLMETVSGARGGMKYRITSGGLEVATKR